MRTLLIAGLCALAAGCAELPPTAAFVAPDGLPSGLVTAAAGDCGGWRTRDGVATCRGAQLPEQIVGEERHAEVLDGRS